MPNAARSHQIILDQEHDLWLGQTRLSGRRMTPMKLYSDGRSVDRVQHHYLVGQVVLPDSNINPTVPLLAHKDDTRRRECYFRDHSRHLIQHKPGSGRKRAIYLQITAWET